MGFDFEISKMKKTLKISRVIVVAFRCYVGFAQSITISSTTTSFIIITLGHQYGATRPRAQDRSEGVAFHAFYLSISMNTETR